MVQTKFVLTEDNVKRFEGGVMSVEDFKLIEKKDDLVGQLSRGFEFGPSVVGKSFALMGPPREDKVRRYLQHFPIANAETNARLNWNQYQMGSLLVRETDANGKLKKASESFRTWFMWCRDERKLIEYFKVSSFRENTQGGNQVFPVFSFDWKKVAGLDGHGDESVSLLLTNWGEIVDDPVKRAKRSAFLKDLRLRYDPKDYLSGEYLNKDGSVNANGLNIRQGALIIEPFFCQTVSLIG